MLPGTRERLDDKRRGGLGEALAASRAQHTGDDLVRTSLPVRGRFVSALLG